MMKNKKYSPVGKNVFLVSFLAGTLIFISFLLTQSDFLFILGFYYVIAAAIINMIVLLYELLEFLTDIAEHKASGNSVLLLLLNIPVVIIYLLILLNIYLS